MSCYNTYILNKQLKVVRIVDDSLFIFWIGKPLSDSATDGLINNSKIESIKEYTGVEASAQSYFINSLVNGVDMLFFTKTTNSSLNLPIDKSGALNSNVFWCGFIDDANKFSPIEGIKYYDMNYNKKDNSIDLVFWANVNVDHLPQTKPDDNGITQFGTFLTGNKQEVSAPSDNNIVYPDSIRDFYPVISDVKSQRVVFYSHGVYRDFVVSTATSSVVTGMFIFTKPRIILCSGTVNGVSEQIYNEIPPAMFMDYR